VIYFAYVRREQIYLFFVYAKNEREDMTAEQKRAVRRAVKIIQKEG
jgi:hypothetical protein